MSLGIILLFHGSGEPKWLETALRQKEYVAKASPEAIIEIACLKEFEPSILEAAGRLIESGCVRGLVVPMFIAPGGHAAKDFPRLASELNSLYPHVQFIWTDVVGAWEEVAMAVAGGVADRIARIKEKS